MEHLDCKWIMLSMRKASLQNLLIFSKKKFSFLRVSGSNKMFNRVAYKNMRLFSLSLRDLSFLNMTTLYRFHITTNRCSLLPLLHLRLFPPCLSLL